MDKLKQRYKLKKLILRQYKTINSAAIRSGISPSYLSMVLSGDADLPIKHIGNMAVALEIDIKKLECLLSDSETDKKAYRNLVKSIRKEKKHDSRPDIQTSS